MTAEEIIKKLKEKFGEDSYYFSELYENSGEVDEEFGMIEGVDEQGGHEGGGDYAMRVVHFVDHNVYIKEEGFYSSYNGADWEGNFIQVLPKEKTITFYE